MFYFYWHIKYFKGIFSMDRWIANCSWKPKQEVNWCFAPGCDKQSVHSLNISFSSAHDGTSGSDELQRDKRTNAIQTLGAICPNAARSHESQLLDFAKVLDEATAQKVSTYLLSTSCLVPVLLWGCLSIAIEDLVAHEHYKEMCRCFIVKSTN